VQFGCSLVHNPIKFAPDFFGVQFGRICTSLWQGANGMQILVANAQWSTRLKIQFSFKSTIDCYQQQAMNHIHVLDRQFLSRQQEYI